MVLQFWGAHLCTEDLLWGALGQRGGLGEGGRGEDGERAQQGIHPHGSSVCRHTPVPSFPSRPLRPLGPPSPHRRGRPLGATAQTPAAAK